MRRLLPKRPSQKICKLCKKYRIKLTVKKGRRKVYKSKRVIMKQLRKRMKRTSRFGSCGCNSRLLRFGKKRTKTRKTKMIKINKSRIRKLHKLCRIYGVKIGKKSPSVLAQQCIRRAKMMLKRQTKFGKRGRKIRFGGGNVDFMNVDRAPDSIDRLKMYIKESEHENSERTLEKLVDLLGGGSNTREKILLLKLNPFVKRYGKMKLRDIMKL